MAGQPKPPLTEADYKKLNERLADLANLRLDIERALGAGFDCGQEQALCDELTKRLLQIKKSYFPELP